MPMLSLIEKRLDGALIVAAEVTKGSVKEVWRVGTQLLNGGAAAVLHLIHPEAGGKYYLESRRRIHRRTSLLKAAAIESGDRSGSEAGDSTTPPRRSLLLWLVRAVVGRLLAFLHLAFPDLWRAVDSGRAEPAPRPAPAAGAPEPRTPPRTQSSPALASGAFRNLVTPASQRRKHNGVDIPRLPLPPSERPPRRRTFGRSPDTSPRSPRPPTTILEASPPPAPAVAAPPPLPPPPAPSWTGIHNRPTDRVFAFEKNTTGLFEDLQLSLLLYLDLFFGGVRALLRAAARSLRTLSPTTLFRALRRFVSVLWKGLRVFRPAGMSHPSAPRPDRRSVGEIVRAAGYVYEAHTVVTDDGYLLTLDRIARPESKKVVFFQHGLLDTSFAWISTGTIGGLAFRACDMGYDVYLGNFRGTGGRGHVNPNIKPEAYWDFSVNEHYASDVPACVRAIRRIKARELSSGPAPASAVIGESAAPVPLQPSPPPPPDCTITAVAHSMGAAALLMNVMHSRRKGIPHHLSHLILLSPAGHHKHVPRPLRLLAYSFNWLVARWVHAIVIPTGPVHALLIKLLQDVRNMPAAMDLLAYFFAFFLGGEMQSSPFKYVDWLSYRNSSPSSRVFRHGCQILYSNRFQAYDFGPKRNEAEYGSREPLNFDRLYHLIDVPVDIMAGEKDWLIPVIDARWHYEFLSRHRPDLARLRVFPKMGHMDFTLGLDDDVISTVLATLRAPPGAAGGSVRAAPGAAPR